MMDNALLAKLIVLIAAWFILKALFGGWQVCIVRDEFGWHCWVERKPDA